MLDAPSKETGPKGQSRYWITGNKIIQIRTGLFSNICVEDQSLTSTRKPRLTSNGRNVSQSSKAINIPIVAQTNENLASSGGSSVGNNNSYSSASLNSNNAIASSASSKTLSNGKDSDNGVDKFCDSGAKSEQEFFDDTIDANVLTRSSETEETSKATNFQSSSYGNGNRWKNSKRRYKSGVPTTADRNEDDSSEETFSKVLSDAAITKLSKDDSGKLLFPLKEIILYIETKLIGYFKI